MMYVDIPERLFSELVVGEILRYVGFGQGGLGLVISLHFEMGVGLYFSRRPFWVPFL
jgi:hypothetical protein